MKRHPDFILRKDRPEETPFDLKKLPMWRKPNDWNHSNWFVGGVAPEGQYVESGWFGCDDDLYTRLNATAIPHDDAWRLRLWWDASGPSD